MGQQYTSQAAGGKDSHEMTTAEVGEETDSGFFFSEAPFLAVKREMFHACRLSAVFGEGRASLFAEKRESSDEFVFISGVGGSAIS